MYLVQNKMTISESLYSNSWFLYKCKALMKEKTYK